MVEVVAVFRRGGFIKVVVRRRAAAFPFQGRATPRVGGRLAAIDQRLQQVERRQEEAHRHDVRTNRGNEVVRVEQFGGLGRPAQTSLVIVVPAWHALGAQHELGEEGQVEADEDDPGSNLSQTFVVHATGDLGPPVVQAADHRNQGGTHHHVVEVGHHEVRVVQLNIGGQDRQRQTRQTTNGKDEQEGQGVQHRRGERDAAFVHREDPVEDLHRRRNGHREGDRGEDGVHQRGLTTGEHVVAPHQEREERNRHGGERDHLVAKDFTAAVHRDQLGDDAHRRENHDVHRGVAVEPEEVLEQHRVTAQSRIKNTDAHDAFGRKQQHGDAEDGRRQHLNDRGGVERPEEQGQLEPSHPGGDAVAARSR